MIGEGEEEGETERSTSIPVTSPLDESGDKHIFPNGKYYEKYFYGRTYAFIEPNQQFILEEEISFPIF